MSTYVVGDIHGQHELFIDLLEQINFRDHNQLYTMGDIIDRGKHPIKVLKKL